MSNPCPICSEANFKPYVDTFSDVLFKDLITGDLVAGIAKGNLAQVIDSGGGIFGIVRFFSSKLKEAVRLECKKCGNVVLNCKHCGQNQIPDKDVRVGARIRCGNCSYVSVVS